MVVGYGTAWGDYKYFTQDYESATDASSWSSVNYSGGLSLATGVADYGKYIKFEQSGDALSGPRTACTNFFDETSFYNEYQSYTVKFDVAIQTGSHASSSTEVIVASDGYSLEGNKFFITTNGLNTNYLFALRSIAGANTTTFIINEESDEINIPVTSWVHVELSVDMTNRKVFYWLTGSVTASGSYDVPLGTSMEAKGIVATLGRGANSKVWIDNIKLYSIRYYLSAGTPTTTVIYTSFGAKGAKVKHPYPHYILQNNSLYRFAPKVVDPNYEHPFTLAGDADPLEVAWLNHDNSPVTNVVTYREAEDFMTPITRNAYVANRCSNMQGGYSSAYVDALTLPTGMYKLSAASYANSSTIFRFRVGESEVFTHTGNGGWHETTSSDPFQVSRGQTVQVIGGSRSYALDYVYAQAIFAYLTASGSMTINTTFTPTLTNSFDMTGYTVRYISLNKGIATVDETTGMISALHNGNTIIRALLLTDAEAVKDANEWTASAMAEYSVTVTGEAPAGMGYSPAYPTDTETFAVTSAGYLPETCSGSTVSVSFGSPSEVQVAETIGGKTGIKSIDANGLSHVFIGNAGTPSMGSYFTFVPKQSGVLTIHGYLNAANALRLVDAEGSVLERIPASSVTVNDWKDYTFSTLLNSGATYYVFPETKWMTPHDGETFPTLWMNSFIFKQRNGTTINLVDQSLLFFPNNNGNFNRLDRSIPGFDITFKGDGWKYQSAKTFIVRYDANGTENNYMKITPRLATGSASDVVINSVKVIYDNTTDFNSPIVSINGKDAYSLSTSEMSHSWTPNSHDVTITLTSGAGTKFYIRAVELTYTLNGGAVLSSEKQTVDLKFDKDYIYGYDSDVIENKFWTEIPNAYYGDVSFVGDPSVLGSGSGFVNGNTNEVSKIKGNDEKTYYKDVTAEPDEEYKVRIGQGVCLLKATTPETAYFKAGYAETRLYSRDYVETSNTELTAGGTYKVPAGAGTTIQVTVNNEDATITMSNTEDLLSNVVRDGDVFKEKIFTATVSGTGGATQDITITNTGSSAITLKTISVSRRSGELDFSYNGAVGAGSDVLFTSWNYTPNTFTISSETETGIASLYETTGTYTITQPVNGVSINSSTGALTVGPEADNGILKVTLTVNPLEANRALYAPLTKTITLKVVDGMWDFRNYTAADNASMTSSTGWSSGAYNVNSNFADFTDVLRNASNDNTPLPLTLALQVKGKTRLLHSNHGFLHLQGRGVGVNESPYGGGQLRIPAKAGMLVELNCYANDDVSEMEIDNVTDLEGNDITTFYVSAGDTESQYFLAKSDGYIVVRNPSFNLDLHIRYIKVSADMAFKYGNETYIDAGVGTWSNPVMNQGTTTISYAFTNDNSTPVSSINSSTGEVTIGSGQYGKFTVTATGSGTGVLAGKSGSYIAYSIGVTRNSTSSSVAISGTPAEFTLKNLFDIAVGGTGLTESDLKDKIVFNVITPSPTVTLDEGILTVEGVQEVSLTATLGAIMIPFTCEVTGGTLTGGLNPVIANDAESYTITIEGESDHKFNLKAMYDGIMGDIKDSKTSLVFKNVDNPESPVVLSVDATEVSCSNLCIEGFSTIKKGGVIPIYASTTSYPIEGTLTVAYTKHTWDFTSNLIPNLAKWETNSDAGIYTTKTNTWGTGATIDQPTDDGARSDDYHWKFRRKIPGKTDGAIVYYYNHSVEGQNALVIPETEGLHVFASPSNQQLGVEMMQDGGVATVPYDCRNLMLLRGGKVTIPKLKKGQWVELRWTRHKEEMGERILMTNLSDAAGTPITSTYKIGNTFYNLPWSTSTYMFQATNDGDVTFEVADNIYVSIQEIILHEPGWTFQSNFADKLRGYDDISYDETITNVNNALYQKKYKDYTDVEKSSWTGATAPKIDWQYIWDDQGSHTITFLSKEYQNAPNAPQTWKFEMDEMLTRSGAVMTTSSTDGGEAKLTYNGGWGKVKVTMTSYSQNMKYVANQKSWTITFGQAPKQTYPYTWDFTKFFTDTPSAMLNDKTWAAVDYDPKSTRNPLHVAIYNNNTITNYGNGGWSNTYDMADYQSYYVEGAQLVCYGLRGTNNGIIRETAGLGFKLDTDADGVPEENMLMLNMTKTVPEARAAVNRQTWNTITPEGHETESHLTIATGGKVIVPKPNDDAHDYYIYIRSSHKPTSATNVTDRSTDADVPTGVYKYSFSANENAEFTFTSTDVDVDSKLQSYAVPATPVGRKYTDIYVIAVTKDFKTLKKLSGTGWATESRDYAVDYTLDSLLTTRPLQAFSVIARSTNPLYSEEKTKTTVRLQDRNYVVPDRQGLVLKQVTGAPGEDGSTYTVPLFVPAVTTAVEPTYAYTNNLMRPNLTGEAPGTTNAPQTFTSETETINGVDYTRFILSEKYLTWKKDGETGNVTANENFSQGAVPGFFRLHIYSSTEAGALSSDESTLNTLGENKAYLLLRTDRINPAIWTSGAPVRRFDFVGIESVSDIYDWNDESNDKIANDEDAPIFNLNGQPMGNDKSVLAPGIYIRNGKKFVVR